MKKIIIFKYIYLFIITIIMILELTTKIDGNGMISRKIIGRIFNIIFFQKNIRCKKSDLECSKKNIKLLNLAIKFGNPEAFNNIAEYYYLKFHESLKKKEKNEIYINKSFFYVYKGYKLKDKFSTNKIMLNYFYFGIGTKKNINKSIEYSKKIKNYTITSILYLFNNNYNEANKYYNKIININSEDNIYYLYLIEKFENKIDNKLSKNIYSIYISKTNDIKKNLAVHYTLNWDQQIVLFRIYNKGIGGPINKEIAKYYLEETILWKDYFPNYKIFNDAIKLAKEYKL